MFWWVVVFIQLSVFRSCVSNTVDTTCLDKRNLNKILLQSSNIYGLNMNRVLKNHCGYVYDFETENVDLNNHGIQGMIQSSETHPNVINFAVDDYYHFNLRYTSSNGLAYAGDLNGISGNLCGKENGTDMKYCYVKMVTDSVANMDGGHLYNFITKMDINELSDDVMVPNTSCSGVVDNSGLDIVLICSDTDVDISTGMLDQQFCPLRFRYSANCLNDIEIYENKLLAVLTSKPFRVKYELTVPVVFFDTPFSYEEDLEIFPNSVLNAWQMLKYPIMKFLEIMDWRKVAIITDDSPFSAEFEEELTELFRENVVMYTVKRCENRISCDQNVKKVFYSVMEEKTRIIIANFDTTHIKDFRTQDFQWIVRDMSHDSKWWQIGNGYSVTLAPTGHDEALYEKLGLSHRTDGHTKIVENIKHIHHAHQQMASQNDINDISRSKFYKQFADKIKTSMKSMDYVSRVYDDKGNGVAYINVTGQDTNVVRFEPKTAIKDVPNCTFRSNNYFRPCNDNEFILIMLVMIVFATTLLIVTIYFHKSSPVHTGRYVPF